MKPLPFVFTATSSASTAPAEEPASVYSWGTFWQNVANFFVSNVWAIILWFAVLVIGLILIYLISRLIRFIMRKRDVDAMAIRFVSNIVKFVLLLILILILLSMMGVPIGGLTTGISAAVLAVGMALRDFLSHLAAGIILIVSKNYKKGDYIQVNGLEGSIIDINFLFTTLKTYDSTRVTVPNSMMVNNCVTNFEALGIRRLAIHMPLPHEADLALVRPLLVDVMKSNGRVKLDPPPLCRINDIKPDSIDMFLTCYVDIEDYWDVYFYVWDQAYDALKRAGVRIPYHRVSVFQAEEKEEFPVSYKQLPERVEKVRDDNKIRHLNLIDYDELTAEEVAEIMAHNKKVRARQKAQKEETRKAKAAKKSQPEKK